MFSQREAELVDQLTAFASGISADNAKYQVSVPDAVAIQAAVDEFIQKRTVWNTPSTHNPTTYEAKQAAKASALGICRVFYRQIQGNVGISDEDKIAIGVLPLNSTRTPRPCPSTSPAIAITASTPLAMTANFRDSTDLSRRGLAPGATMCQLFVHVGEENAETIDLKTARFVGNYTTNPMPVVFDPEDRGKQATLFARWGGKRNEFGQWSLPVSMTIAA